MGKLVVFEGIDRSGKTTQLNRFYDYLQKIEIKFFVTREPNNRDVRFLLKSGNLSPEDQLDLILRDRVEHSHLIKFLLEDSELVLCDRFTPSTLAYQGYGHGMDIERLNALNEKATQGIKADKVILFDCPIDRALKRNTGKPLDHIEQDPLFLDRVRFGYLELARKNNWDVIDASQSPDQVFEAVKNLILPCGCGITV